MKGEVNSLFNQIIKLVNEAKKPILYIDIPLSLDCDTGSRLINLLHSHSIKEISSKL